ncbi:conjugative transfer system coupling protein TraD [Paraburkholderia fungorum]|jgi:conjugal transfer pilus assembly protein TraD|uniref:Conjugative transfer system coupling protein TraD n=1 Tax=Paraburkholderia fungorum TaxID=134537 RepID=A0AAP5QI18_9BURK|nr:conjugative transfer system coupling protein TraD [Paraburkholderia fungorum]MDT8842599.1 conjugative transfer system coupling protein TraD [Paraburkholderia fungorum]
MNYINHFRPIYEFRPLLIWPVVIVGILTSGMPYAWAFSLACLVLLLVRGTQVWRALSFRMAISTKWLSKIQIGKLLDTQNKMRDRENSMYLGTGFEWTQKHTQIAHDILRMPVTDIPSLPKWLNKTNIGRAVETRIELLFAPADSVRDRMPQGSSWIHGMEPKKVRVPFHYKAMGGHTLVGGTTGSGKTRTYEVISTQVIHNPNDVLIIVDPKNDDDWKNRVEKECARTGRKFLYFNQAKPHESIRLNPLENWSQPSEIPSRIAQLMEEGPFRDFAFLFIDRAVKGELYVGDKPNLRSILKYAQSGIGTLLDRSLRRFFVEHGLTNWEELTVASTVKDAVGRKNDVSLVDGMAKLYMDRFAANDRGHETIDGLIATHTHDREHYMRIIASALPLLQMLATGETGLMLAPKADDFEDEREIWDIDKIIKQKAVLYMGLDSLSNNIVQKAIASMALSDVAAVCGSIYNFYKVKPEVVLIIDEIAEAINEQVIQILNKGRGAGFKAFVAFQARADLEAKLGNAAKMLQVLGNLNNQIILRLEDSDTAKWFSDKVGETAIRVVNISNGMNTSTESHFMEFTGSQSRSLQLEKVPLIPVRLIHSLPNLQYFMRISGGAVYQGRIPIIEG